MDISIIILNYKSKGFALNCIKSIKETDFDNLKYEIIVVDNNSEDYIEIKSEVQRGKYKIFLTK